MHIMSSVEIVNSDIYFKILKSLLIDFNLRIQSDFELIIYSFGAFNIRVQN